MPDDDGANLLESLDPAEHARQTMRRDAQPTTVLVRRHRGREIALCADIPPGKPVVRAVGARIVTIHDEIARLGDIQLRNRS